MSLFNPDMDELIVKAWPQLAVIEGLTPLQIKARAYRIGLRLDPAEARRRQRVGFSKQLGKADRWRDVNLSRTWGGRGKPGRKGS